MADDEITAQAQTPAEAGAPFGHFVVPRRADGSLWELGRGAMGVTYRAFDTSLRIDVALKVVAASLVQESDVRRRFQREARAAAKIRHPNVASVLYLGEQEGDFFYAMEFVIGRSLESLLRAEAGPLPVAVAIALAGQAAAALNAAHRREVVHRDLKPANLMLLEGEAVDHEDERTQAAGHRQLKVIDFGLARSFSAIKEDESLVTQSFAGFIGTPAYASPEQCSGEANLDGRADLYSLGVILWRMLTGRLPFTGGVVEMLGKQQFQAPPFERLDEFGLPAEVIAVLRGLLIKDPAQRQPQTAGELRTILDDLLRLLATGGGSAAGTETVLAPLDEESRNTSDSTIPPAVGTTVLARYRLGNEMSPGDGGRLFVAADNQQPGLRLGLKLIAPERLAEPGFTARLENALARLNDYPHPLFLVHPQGLQRSTQATCYVREWAEGFSLRELLQTRGALRGVEVRALLEGLPSALDYAASSGYPLLEVALHKLFVVPRGAKATPADWGDLRSLAVVGWPAFALKLNPLGFSPAASSGSDGGQPPDLTRQQAPSGSAAGGLVPAFARVVHELLSGPAGSSALLAMLSDEGNAILRRALAPGVAPTAFANVSDFAAAFFATIDRISGRSTPAAAMAALPPMPSAPGAASATRPAAGSRIAPSPAPLPPSLPPPAVVPTPLPVSERARRQLPFWIIAGAVCLYLVNMVRGCSKDDTSSSRSHKPSTFSIVVDDTPSPTPTPTPTSSPSPPPPSPPSLPTSTPAN